MSYIQNIYSKISNDDILKYINFEQIRQEDKEFIRNDLWHFEFITSPPAVYFPGQELIQARLKTVSFDTEENITTLNAVIRQFNINQAVIGGNTNGTITLNFVDREDQAIALMIDDWREKIFSRSNRFAYRKVDLMCDCKLQVFNTNRAVIREYIFRNCQSNKTLEPFGTTSDSPDTTNTELDFGMSFEHYELIWYIGTVTEGIKAIKGSNIQKPSY